MVSMRHGEGRADYQDLEWCYFRFQVLFLFLLIPLFLSLFNLESRLFSPQVLSAANC